MIVREANQEDMEALLAIEQSCFRKERFHQAYIEALLSSEGVDVVVGVVKGEVVASAMVEHEVSGRSHLLSLATDPGHQGRGYSKSMLAKVEELAQERGSCIIFLEVRVDNAPALKLYQANGYRTIRLLHDFFGPREDAWHMEKSI